MQWFAKGKTAKPRFVNYRLVNKNLQMKVANVNGDLWFTQKQLAEIFGLAIPTIHEHLKRIFQLVDFPESKLSQKFPVKAKDGKTYQVIHYHGQILEEIQRRVKN